MIFFFQAFKVAKFEWIQAIWDNSTLYPMGKSLSCHPLNRKKKVRKKVALICYDDKNENKMKTILQ